MLLLLLFIVFVFLFWLWCNVIEVYVCFILVDVTNSVVASFSNHWILYVERVKKKVMTIWWKKRAKKTHTHTFRMNSNTMMCYVSDYGVSFKSTLVVTHNRWFVGHKEHKTHSQPYRQSAKRMGREQIIAIIIHSSQLIIYSLWTFQLLVYECNLDYEWKTVFVDFPWNQR